MLVLTALGAAVRLLAAGRGLYGDELSTFWIVTAHRAAAGLPALHGLPGVLSLVGHVYPGGNTAEISPPLFFVASWLTTQLGHDPEWVRLPSLLAGIAVVPLVYAVGVCTIRRRAALLAAALSALSPFLIYYSTEARAYALMTAAVLLAALGALRGLETGRRGWWVVYAISAAAAMYSHYTAVFTLAALVIWILLSAPAARRVAVAATFLAAILYVPWVPGAIHDLRSPTADTLSVLLPFDASTVRHELGQWVIGYPNTLVGLREVPGKAAIVALLGALVIAAIGSVRSIQDRRSAGASADLDRRLILVAALALSAPVGEAIVSALGTHLFGIRNLASSTPWLLMLGAAWLMSSGRRLRFAAGALALLSFAIAAVRLLQPQFQRPDITSAAAYIERTASSGSVVIDETAQLSPGPLSPFDLVFHAPLAVVRGNSRVERDRPFSLAAPVVPLAVAVRRAVALAHGHVVFVVRNSLSTPPDSTSSPFNALVPTVASGARPPVSQRIALPAPYRLVGSRTFSGFPGVQVQVYGT